jgi:hypothetical protein
MMASYTNIMEGVWLPGPREPLVLEFIFGSFRSLLIARLLYAQGGRLPREDGAHRHSVLVPAKWICKGYGDID